MLFNRPAIEEKMVALSRYLGLEGMGFDAVYAWVLAFRTQLGIPGSLGAIRVPVDQAETIGDHAQRDPSTGGNPRATSPADMTAIFKAAVAGMH
jgi:alcohol dehydrogenase class IV